jgi:hypothetical protein
MKKRSATKEPAFLLAFWGKLYEDLSKDSTIVTCDLKVHNAKL